VNRLRHDPALRTRLGKAAQHKVEREFDADAVVARIERLYEDLHASGAGPAGRARERVEGSGGAKPPGNK